MEPGPSERIGPVVAVHGADGHPHVLRRLRRDLPSVTWLETATDEVPAGASQLRLTTDPRRAEGEFTLDVGDGSAAVTGGPLSGVVYGVGELVRLAQRDGATLLVPGGRRTHCPALPYRTLWTWDHSTNWHLDQIGMQEIGAMNVYAKRADGFLADYCRLVDFMSDQRIGAVVVYGLLRDDHGGVEAADQLCRYASERGVRIIAGIGVNAYGGVYWEGDHPYNLATWLRRNPHLAAQLARPVGFEIADYGHLPFPRNDYAMTACPSRPENAAFNEEAVAWLTETLPIGGINFETGDYGVCECDDCRRRRTADSSWSLADMAKLYPRLFEAARSRRDDLWLYCEVYWDNILDLQAQRPLAALPDDPIYQYCINRSYWPRVQRELDPAHVAAMPHTRNVLRTHMGTQWNQERYAFIGQDFAAMATLAHASGLQGVTIFGEVSEYSVPNELNYLAFARFSENPNLSWDGFLADEVAPRLGGLAAASWFLEVISRLDTADVRQLQRWRDEARDIGNGHPGEAARRWLWLEERMSRRAFGLTRQVAP